MAAANSQGIADAKHGYLIRPETIFRNRWPTTPEYAALARDLSRRLSREMIALIFAGIDLLHAEVLATAWGEAPAQLERSLGQLLYVRMARSQDRALPFVIIHEPWDPEYLVNRRARPPQPDIGFVLNAFERAVWPVEMKVMRADDDVGEYCDEVRGNFLTGRYASFSGEGAMLGYLLTGNPEVAYKNIAMNVPCVLTVGEFEPPRLHRVSKHDREVPAEEYYSTTLICHHLLVQVGPESVGGGKDGGAQAA
jgi:hypothetical protein